MNDTNKSILISLSFFVFLSCSHIPENKVQNGNMIYEINDIMQTRVQWDGLSDQPVDFGFSDALITDNTEEFQTLHIESFGKTTDIRQDRHRRDVLFSR